MISSSLSVKDQRLSVIAGLLIGILCLPVLKTASPDLYDIFFFLSVPFFILSVPLELFVAKKISKKISFVWQAAKFGIIGVLNTFVDLGIFSFLIFFTESYAGIDQKLPVIAGVSFFSYFALSKSISFLFANINSYYWNKYWTFDHRIREKTNLEFIQFFTVSIVGFLINVSVSSTIFTWFYPLFGLNTGQWGLIGALSGTLAGLLWNFIGYKFIVFKK